MPVVRFGVSLEMELLDALDAYTEENHFSNRSQALRHLIARNLVTKKWKSNEVVAGSVTLLYDHHKRDVLNNLTEIQHDYHDVILSSQHIHLDHDNCLEIIAMKGRAPVLKELADRLIAVKGIHHGQLTMSSAG
ncbi:MAG: nickel-responsive transcriptional regulator NikR [Saprospiraceae bacterium]|jgi:CopG family nickel-responsive transcriptional regulator